MSLPSCLTAVREYDVLKKLTNKEFSLEAFKSDFLMNKDVIKMYDEFLNCIPSTSKEGISLTSRDVLSAYLFAFFDFGEELKVHSLELINIIHSHESTPHDIFDTLKKYDEVYQAWKKNDVKELLQSLSQLYWEYELIYELNKLKFTDEEKEAFLKQKEPKQRQLLDRMKKIDNLEYFYSYQPVVFDEAAVQQVHEFLKATYWDKLKQELPDISGVLNVFKEVRGYLSALYNGAQNPLEQYDEAVDLNYMEQLHTLGATDMTYWLNKCSYLKHVLCDLDSAAMIEHHERFWEQVVQSIHAEDPKKNGYVFIDFLSYVVERLTKLVQLKRDFYAEKIDTGLSNKI